MNGHDRFLGGARDGERVPLVLGDRRAVYVQVLTRFVVEPVDRHLDAHHVRAGGFVARRKEKRNLVDI